MCDRAIEDLLRRLTPQVLGAVVRRYGHFDTAEDAVQEALLAAATQWPAHGTPSDPRAWLITVAARRLTDTLRAEQARRRRETTQARLIPPGQWQAPAADHSPTEGDDTLILLFLCCHPALSPASQIALTLRAVGGLTTAEIARAFLVPEATMTRRITRAKQAITDSGAPFAAPTSDERDDRVAAVRHALYLIFTEGYAATTGPALMRADLCTEAIRLTRLLHRLLPGDTETAGLLALMLLTDARRPARTGPGAELIPMADQDRTRWDTAAITEGVALITTTLRRMRPGPYQLQAAIAAVHDEAPTAEATDWPQILALYELLLQASDNPVVALNHAVAVAMVHGAQAGLGLLDDLAGDTRLTSQPPLPRRPRAAAGTRRRRARRPRRLPTSRATDHQSPAPALPVRASSPARGTRPLKTAQRTIDASSAMFQHCPAPGCRRVFKRTVDEGTFVTAWVTSDDAQGTRPTSRDQVSARIDRAGGRSHTSAAVKPPGVAGYRKLEGDRREAEQHPECGDLAPHGVRVARVGDRADDECCYGHEHEISIDRSCGG